MLLTREEVFSKVAEIISKHFEIDKDKVTVELSIKDDLNADSISIMEFVLELEDEFGTEISDEDLLDTWYIGLNAIPQMEELPKRLKEKGLSLYILSNAPQDYYLYEDKVPSHSIFDGIFISSDWKLSKPEHEIFRTFYSHFRLNPAECYFIDDSAANILAAEETGMNGFHFKRNFSALEKALTALGVL